MNFILEQIIYFFFKIILNPFSFLNSLKDIKTLPFGREVKKVEIKNGLIYKYYRTRLAYQKNINYYYILKDFYFIPKNIYYDADKYLIVQQFKGRLLRKTDLNDNLKKKLKKIFKLLTNNNIIINDIKPLFFNKNIINNLTTDNNEIYLVDYGDMIINDNKTDFYDNLLKLYID